MSAYTLLKCVNECPEMAYFYFAVITIIKSVVSLFLTQGHMGEEEAGVLL